MALHPADRPPEHLGAGGAGRRRALLGALAGVLLLGTALKLVVLPSTGDRDAAPASAPVPPATPSPAVAPGPLDAVLPELQAFVERERGLTFEQPVRATLLDDAAFLERLDIDELSEEERRGIVALGRVMKALGLLTPEADLLADTQTLLGEGVVGLYDATSDELLVRGAAVDTYTKAVLVHELTHALDDQHFDLDRPELAEGDLEDHLAFSALVEGSARRVELAYVASLPEAERAAVNAAEVAAAAGLGSVAPQAAYYFGAFPYVDGPTFVASLLEAGDQAALDAAFVRPPRTTAEILVPARYRAGISGMRLSPLRVAGEVESTGMLGALGLYLILQSVDPAIAGAAAASWEGDTYVAWRDGERTCVTLRVFMSAPQDSVATAAAFDAWSDHQIDATVAEGGTVIVTSCR